MKDQKAIMRLLQDRIPRGHALASIARDTGIPATELAATAKMAGMHYKNQRPTLEQILSAVRMVMDYNQTIRDAAEMYGLSRSAVHRWVQRARAQAVGIRAEEPDALTFHDRPRGTTCPVHGRITISPCVACAAERSRDRRLVPMGYSS